MFNIGFTEFLVIGVVALLVIGPKQLPEVARIVGRLLTELKRATQDLSGGLLEVTNEVKSSIEDTKQGIMNEGQKIVDSVTKTEEPQDSKEVDSLEPQKDQNEQS
jgi:sec-independent protein translocase protein TatB